MTATTCKICGAPSKDVGEFFRCNKCAHMQRTTKLSGQRRHPLSEWLRSKAFYRILLAYDRTRVREYVRHLDGSHVPSDTFVLDVGSGPRLSLRNFKKFGYVCVGVEPDVSWAKVIPRGDDVVIECPVEDVNPKIYRHVDLVIMSHVIEHVNAPKDVLSTIVHNLSHGARVIVRTPDANAIGYALWGRTWFPLSPEEHISVFSRASLVRLSLWIDNCELGAVSSPIFFGDSLASAWTWSRDRASKRLRVLLLALLPASLVVESVSSVAGYLLDRSAEFQVVLQRTATQRPMLSFVIPAYNEEKRVGLLIRDILTSIETSGVPRDRYEIIVVDNGSTDSTSTVAGRLGVQVRYFGERSIAKARNHGAKAAGGTYLVFMDADTRVSSDFCSSLIDSLAKNFPDCAGVHIVPNGDGGNTAKMLATFVLNGIEKVFSSSFAVFIHRREAFERFGGFDERLYAFEDVAWLIRHKALGYLGTTKRYVVLTGVSASVSTRAFSRKGALATYLSHLVFPWRWRDREHSQYWYAPRESD